MATLAAGAGAKLAGSAGSFVVKKVVPAVPVVVGGVWLGSQSQQVSGLIRGPQDRDRVLESTENAAFSAIPGLVVGGALLLGANKLHVKGPNRVADYVAEFGVKTKAAGRPALTAPDRLRNYGSLVVGGLGAGAIFGGLGGGSLIQNPINRLQEGAKAWTDEHVPFASFLTNPISFDPDSVGQAWNDFTTFETQTPQVKEVTVEPGQVLDPGSLLELPEGAEITSIEERPGVDGGSTLSEVQLDGPRDPEPAAEEPQPAAPD